MKAYTAFENIVLVIVAFWLVSETVKTVGSGMGGSRGFESLGRNFTLNVFAGIVKLSLWLYP
jgi:hypothetical protein